MHLRKAAAADHRSVRVVSNPHRAIVKAATHAPPSAAGGRRWPDVLAANRSSGLATRVARGAAARGVPRCAAAPTHLSPCAAAPGGRRPRRDFAGLPFHSHSHSHVNVRVHSHRVRPMQTSASAASSRACDVHAAPATFRGTPAPCRDERSRAATALRRPAGRRVSAFLSTRPTPGASMQAKPQAKTHVALQCAAPASAGGAGQVPPHVEPAAA